MPIRDGSEKNHVSRAWQRDPKGQTKKITLRAVDKTKKNEAISKAQQTMNQIPHLFSGNWFVLKFHLTFESILNS